MKYHKYDFSVEIIGKRYGHMWNDAMGSQEFHHIPSDDSETLINWVNAILAPDFQDGKLSIDDTFIKITLIKPNRRVARFFDITLFKSIEHLMGRFQ